ncbi:MAG: carotenoid biosynthesis protein [Candidatus Hermodarchaeota archaeon]
MSLATFTIPTATILCGLAVIHAIFNGSSNRIQRLLMLVSLFLYGIFLEVIGIISGHHYYAEEAIMFFGIVPLSIPLAWVGIIYSSMIITERLNLSLGVRILTTSLLALSLDWGMDPIAVSLGLWTWKFEGGSFFGIPSFNFTGWFIISIAYLISYNLNWSREKKRFQILTIREIDNHNSTYRKIYTIFLAIPLALLLMLSIGSITLISFLYNLPLIIVIIFEILTISFISIIILIKRENLKRVILFDIVPPTILIYVAYSYLFLAMITREVFLTIHMLITGIPLVLVLIFTLRKSK